MSSRYSKPCNLIQSFIYQQHSFHLSQLCVRIPRQIRQLIARQGKEGWVTGRRHSLINLAEKGCRGGGECQINSESPKSPSHKKRGVKETFWGLPGSQLAPVKWRARQGKRKTASPSHMECSPIHTQQNFWTIWVKCVHNCWPHPAICAWCLVHIM